MAACGGKADRERQIPPVGGAPGFPTGHAGTGGESADAGAAGIAATPDQGGASDASAGGESFSGEAGQAGATSWTPEAPRSLTTVATEGEWYGKGLTQGLLVAPNSHTEILCRMAHDQTYCSNAHGLSTIAMRVREFVLQHNCY